MASEFVSFHIPERPYSPIDALNRRASAMGSPRYAMAAAYADYNGHHTTLRWNDYRGYYVAEYFWAGRVVLARGGFAECLRAVIAEQNAGKLGSSAGVYPKADDVEAIALCESSELIVKGEPGTAAWYTWRHDCAGAAARDYANPGALVMRFDWELMQTAADQAAYEAALTAKYGSVYEGGFRRPPEGASSDLVDVPPPAPAPKEKPKPRYCYRCKDCLFVSFTEEVLQGGAECAGCGGTIEAMGRVVQKRLTSVEVRCACDGRCTSATGPQCDCSCGGANHGSGAVVHVVKDEGAVPRLSARDADAQYAAAVEYRRAVQAAKGRMAGEYGTLLEDYENGVRIVSYETWSEIKRDFESLRKAKALRSRGGRIKALARICPDGNDTAHSVTPV